MKVMAIALLLACGSAVAADQSPVVELATPVQSGKALGDAKALNMPIEAAARVGEIQFYRDRLVDLGRERLIERANGRAAAGGRFSVELFPGERFTLEHQQTERSFDGVDTWMGKVEGDPNSSFAISVRGNSMYGRLISDRGVYVLQSRGGRAFVTVPDTASMPHQCFEDGRDQPPSSPAVTSKRSATTTKALGGTGNVDILALYSPAVEGRYTCHC